MSDKPMPKWLKILIAVVACAIILIGFNVISVALGFEHGGGYLIMLLLFSFLGGIWRAIVESDKKNSVDIPETGSKGLMNYEVPVAEISEPAASSLVPIEPEPGSVSKVTSDGTQIEKPQHETVADFHIVLKSLLIAMIVIEIIVMIYQTINDFTWENYSLGWIRLVSSIIELVGFILLYKKKISGLIIIVSILLFCIVYSAIMHDTRLGMVICSAVIRLISLSLILLIQKDGISAWDILLRRHTSTVHELKVIFPIKPFLYIKKMQEPVEKDSNALQNNFNNWLNK